MRVIHIDQLTEVLKGFATAYDKKTKSVSGVVVSASSRTDSVGLAIGPVTLDFSVDAIDPRIAIGASVTLHVKTGAIEAVATPAAAAATVPSTAAEKTEAAASKAVAKKADRKESTAVPSTTRRRGQTPTFEMSNP